MDAVYFYKKSSRGELEISVGLLKKFYKELGTVWVIGDTPPASIENEVVHIEHSSQLNKYEDQMSKFAMIVRQQDISDNFLLMMDDIFLLSEYRPIIYRDARYPSLQSRAESRPQDLYRESIENTIDSLAENGLPTFNYELHVPIPFNKHKAIVMTNNLIGESANMQIRSLYYNFYPMDAINAVARYDVKDIRRSEISDILSTSDTKFRNYKSLLQRFL